MAYVLYNISTQEVEKRLSNPYLVDGQPGPLPPNWIQLEVVYGTRPAFDPDTEKLEEVWTRNGDFYEQSFNVVALTAQEIENRRISKIPNKITKAQFFKGMWVVLGKERDEIVTTINNIADTAVKRMRLIELQDEPYIERYSDFTLFIQNHYGYTDLQVDNFFTTAIGL
jgi:hypothetical protein